MPTTPVNLSDPIYNNEDAARAHLEAIRWPDGVACPFCGAKENVRPVQGSSMGPGWYYCGACKDKFTVRVGTVYERSHIALHKWLLGFRLMASSKKGISAHQLHRTLNVTYKSAWFMAHRIREAMRDTDPAPLGGKDKIIEADETFHGPGRPVFSNKKGWQRERGTGGKLKILTLVERGGKARSVKAAHLKATDVRNFVLGNASTESELHTDEARQYSQLGKKFAKHEAIAHAKGEYARGAVTTNTVEGFFSIFKRGMKGVYQHCGEQHLQRYLQEFDFRYSNRTALGVDDAERTNRAVKGAEGKRLTYRRPSFQQTA